MFGTSYSIRVFLGKVFLINLSIKTPTRKIFLFVDLLFLVVRRRRSNDDDACATMMLFPLLTTDRLHPSTMPHVTTLCRQESPDNMTSLRDEQAKLEATAWVVTALSRRDTSW